MRKAIKNIISLTVVLITGLHYIVPAFAQDPFSGIAIGGFGGATGAGLFGSMASASGINIGWGSNTADQMDAMWNSLNPDHVYFSGEKHEANPQSDPEDIYDYINVDIGDWLSAQSDFIVNFAQTHNVDDNDSGTVQGGVTTLLGLPATVNGNYLVTTPIEIPATPGQYPYGIGYVNVTGTGPYSFKYVHPNQGTAGIYSGNVGCLFRFSCPIDGSNVSLKYSQDNGQTWSGNSYYTNGKETENYDVDWTSGNVNTNVFNGWESAKVKIPHNISGLQPGWTVTEFLNVLDIIWQGHGEDNIVIEDGGDDPPVPPPPLPTTPIAEVPFDEWVDLWGTTVTEKQDETNDKLDLIGSNGHDQIEELQEVNNNLQETNDTLDNIDTNVADIADHVENIDTNIDTMADDVSNIDTNVADIADHVENIDTNVEDIEDIAGSIDTNIGIGNGLLGDIKSLLQSAVDWLESIAENVAELVESVVQATETLIAGILNQIPAVFGVIFGPIKQASSIWHYVVEWIQSISAPMSWIWTMASGTSYNIILPVYASLAGAVVLAFYKRFGK